MIEAPHYIGAHWDKERWPNFKAKEFSCRCCGALKIDPTLLDMLQSVRTASGMGMTITSGYRCPEHNQAVGGSSKSAHVDGDAADILCNRGGAFLLLRHIMTHDALGGLGVYQSGVTRFLHVDVSTRASRPTIWSQ